MRRVDTAMMGMNVMVVTPEVPFESPMPGATMIGVGHEHGQGDDVPIVSVLIDDAQGGARVAVLTVEQAKEVAMLMIQAVACLNGDLRTADALPARSVH